MKSVRRTFLILTLLVPLTVLLSSVSLAKSKLEATIFSYDGTDFVRTETTLKQNGESAADTKLDHASAAYKALAEKHSYSGPATVFGQNYDSYYAPIISDDGAVTGAIFVGMPK
jgi:methyl-accepting chemotaxis protein